MKDTKITNKEFRALSITIASCGILLIGSGLIMSTSDQTVVQKRYSVEINERKVAESKTNEIKLKNMELEVNNALSVNVKDYLENYNEIENSVLKALKLDTSLVNISQPGSYTYTISFKKKTYNGTFVIKEKPLPEMELTLKELTIAKDTALSTDFSTYIVETLSDEVKANITLDLSKVNASQVGVYQYTVTYNGKVYTSTINVYVQNIITPNTPTDPETENNNTENKENNTETNTDNNTPTDTTTPVQPTPDTTTPTE